MSPHPPVRRGASAPAVAFAFYAAVAAAFPTPARGGEGAATGAAAQLAAPATGGPQPPAPEVELPEVVVQLPRTRPAEDPTAASSLVSADAFAGEAKGAAEMVATAPGVAVHEQGGPGQIATVSVRGSTSDGVLVLLDGLPLNTAAGGGVDLSSIPRAWISRIEVVRGPEGARYGAGALGGVVNVVTRTPEPGSWSASATGGSFGTWSAAADGAARAGPWTATAAAGADGTDGRFPYLRAAFLPGTAPTPLVRENDAAWRAGVLSRAGRDVGAARLDLLLQLSAGHRQLPGLPPPPGAENAPPPADWMSDARALAVARLAGPAPWGSGVLSGRLHLRLDRLDTFVAAAGSVPTRQRGDAAGAAIEVRQPHALGFLRAGAEGGAERLDSTALDGTRARATAAGWLAEDVLVAGRVRLAPAVRVEAAAPFAGWSASLGATADLGAGLEARATAARTFRPPSLSELWLDQGPVVGNPALRPEQAAGGDAGLAARGAAGFAAATAYALLYDDLVYYQPASFGRFQPQNVGRVLVRGVEVEAAAARWREAAGLSAQAAYTLLASEVLRGAPGELGKEVPRRARHRLYARASVAPGPLEVHVESQYVGRMWNDARNLSAIPAMLVWNGGASVRLSRSPFLRVHLEVRNLADDRTFVDPFGYPLPGRMVLVTLRAADRETESLP